MMKTQLALTTIFALAFSASAAAVGVKSQVEVEKKLEVQESTKQAMEKSEEQREAAKQRAEEAKERAERAKQRAEEAKAKAKMKSKISVLTKGLFHLIGEINCKQVEGYTYNYPLKYLKHVLIESI